MELYHETAQDTKGNITNGATVTVTIASSGAPATIYDADENALSNPFSSGYDRSNGEIDFRAANGQYNVQVGADTTITLEATLFDGRETTYNLTGTIIDPINGTLQYGTLTANTTFTEELAEGDSLTLQINDGTAYTVTWPTMTWVGAVAPTLPTTGYAVIVMWKVDSILYGVHIGDA